MPSKTVKEYLDGLVERSLKNRQLANFLEEHDFVGTLRGSPVWRRNEKFYRRNARG